MSEKTIALDSINLSDMNFWAGPEERREEVFEVLRRERPVSFHPQPRSELFPDLEPTGAGFWAVVRHEDVSTVSHDPATFSSAQGVALDDFPPEVLVLLQSFLILDDPDHKRLRGLVQSAFVPRQIRRITDDIRRRASEIVDDLIETGDCEFIEHVSSRLPTFTLWDMWGVPDHNRGALRDAVEKLIGNADPAILEGRPPAEVMFENAMFLRQYASEFAEDRRSQPADDLMTALVNAEVDGERLSNEDIGGFFVLLAIAGLDTSRHTISHGMKALTDFPAQRAILLEDLAGRMPAAIEEFVRWATPVMTFRRTATRDVELGGERIAAGDKVVMFYGSANRDHDIFDDPYRLNVLRTPNRHVGFGGGGPHFCLGAHLARTQIGAMFTELLTRVPALEVDTPVPLVSSFIHGITAMPCRLNL